MAKRGFASVVLLLLLSITVLAPVLADEAVQASAQRRSQILMQRAQKAEERGDIEEAVVSYEEAYEAYPKNVLPLLMWGRALQRVGMHARAAELLNRIPLDILPENGQAEVYLLLAKIAIAQGTIETAASSLSQAVKVVPDNATGRLRLALVNQILGMPNRARELIADYEDFSGLEYKDLVGALMLDLQLGNFGRAFDTAADMAHMIFRFGSSYSSFSNSSFMIFFSLLPVALGPFLSALYFGLLMLALVFVASRLSSPTAIWHDFGFVIVATAIFMILQHFGLKTLLMAAMIDEFSLHDSIWILPRLAISMHFLTLGLFFAFPAFSFLPDKQRPRRYEYYGVWFFCWWFTVFVLVFQSRLSPGNQIVFLSLSFVMGLITIFFMPLGRLLLFRITSALGIQGVVDVTRQDLESSSSLSFSDAKILESKCAALLLKDEFDEVILISRKVLNGADPKTFPHLWQSMIFALIAREDFLEAEKSLENYQKVFINTSMNDLGELLKAFVKSYKGDFASSLKIVQGFSDARIKGLTQDQRAMCLLILGRCNLECKDNVQAHIDLNKALNCAKMPLLRAMALVEIAELDYKMKAVDALEKLRNKAEALKGGCKSLALRKTTLSIIAFGLGDSKLAFELAAEACEVKCRVSRSCGWYGNLLVLSNKSSEAEQLLDKMTAESDDATKLMIKVTSGAR